jgi:uncharacterized membrane protein
MDCFRRLQRGRLRLERVEGFSDGVLAVVVTVLVLELKAPNLADAQSPAEPAHQLRELLPKFMSGLVGFVIVIVGKFWLNHHQVSGLARYAAFLVHLPTPRLFIMPVTRRDVPLAANAED